MLTSVARKLVESLQRGDPFEPDWFQEALTTAMNKRIGVDQVIWEAVRELLDQVQQEKDGAPSNPI